MNASNDFGRQFYPFLHAPLARESGALSALLAAARQSTLDKCAETVALRREIFEEYSLTLGAAASEMASRFASGGKLLAFGNGGSATDADDAAIDCTLPSRREWRAIPALSLPSDSATLSAVANDVGIEHVFSRQLAALGDARDIALGISTSGQASNVVAGLSAARKRGLLTIAFTGYDGGTITRDGLADFCFVARRQFVPRIQEGHATLWHALLSLVQNVLHNPATAVTAFEAEREAVA